MKLVLGRGNTTSCAEFNFHSDPEAAYVTFNELQCPVTLATWELSLDVALNWVQRHLFFAYLLLRVLKLILYYRMNMTPFVKASLKCQIFCKKSKGK